MYSPSLLPSSGGRHTGGACFFQLHHFYVKTKRQVPFVSSRNHSSRSFHSVQATVSSQDASSSTSSSSGSGASSSRNDKEAGRSTYKPASFKELVQDAAVAVIAALADGETKMEVEFPVLPGSDVRYKGSSDAFIDAAVQLALAGARQINEVTGKRVHILVPDEAEYRRSGKMFRNSLEMSAGVSMGYLSEGKRGLLGGLSTLFSGNDGADLPDPKISAAQADVFLAINASTVELKEIERYSNEVIGERPLVLWCLELDLLRADLGLLGFPGKELQYRFLSQFKPVFYIRQRDYSKSIAVAPFIINYSGILFREYPGPWQAMLRQDNGVYACVAEQQGRYTLSQFKEELMDSMGLTEGEDEAAKFLRRGYKTSTWWEDASQEELSSSWRS